MTSWLFNETDNLATLIGYALVAMATGLAYRQWRREQKWKRKQALIDHIHSFDHTPGARNAMMMLNSHDRDIPLWGSVRACELGGCSESAYST